MANRGVAYLGPGTVETRDIPDPVLRLEYTDNVRDCQHGVILKVVSTNICGSDQHMVRGRTTAPAGLVLGHEITGEVIEAGRDVEFISCWRHRLRPFNIACGPVPQLQGGQDRGLPEREPGAAWSRIRLCRHGGWIGGQAEYVMVPYADWNLLKFPDRDQAMEKILDLTMLSDIFPTGYHGAKTAGVTSGSTVYVAGAGPVGLASAASSWLLGPPTSSSAISSTSGSSKHVASGAPRST